MRQYELIIAELWRRIESVESIKRTDRNPVAKPSVSDMPLVHIFDMGQKVTSTGRSGKIGIPTITWNATIVLELFIKGSTNTLATTELINQLIAILKAIYSDGSSLGGLCLINLKETTRVFKPPLGSYVTGIGVSFSVQYVEDLNLL